MKRSPLLINVVTLCCAAGMIAAFAFLPWLNLPGAHGVSHLPGEQPTLIPLSAICAGLMALWAIFVPRQRGITSIGVAVAGMIGWAYFALGIAHTLLENGRYVDFFLLRGSGFWVVFVATLEMILQLFLTRQPESAAAPGGSRLSHGWLARVFAVVDTDGQGPGAFEAVQDA